MSDAISLFRRATREGEEARNLQRIAREPMQKRALDQFRKAVDRAPDAKAALRDPRVLGVLAQALGIPQAASQSRLGDAVLFEDSASGATSAYAVLGNPVMRRVVTKALGLPEQIAFQSVETQAGAIESRLKLDKLGDPREVRKLAERYLTVRATEAGAGGASPVAALMAARGITLLA